MDDRKELGKISVFDVGIGGYQDAMLGIHMTFEGRGWGVCTSECFWSPSMVSMSENTKWTEKERSSSFDNIMRTIDKTLSEAKVKRTQDLIGIPVEVTFDNKRTIKSWRILTEVI